jgi:hypothetical protein
MNILRPWGQVYHRPRPITCSFCGHKNIKSEICYVCKNMLTIKPLLKSTPSKPKGEREEIIIIIIYKGSIIIAYAIFT